MQYGLLRIQLRALVYTGVDSLHIFHMATGGHYYDKGNQ